MSVKNYFDPQAFVLKIIEDCKFDSLSAEMRNKLWEMISERLIERVTVTVVDSFGEQEFMELEKMLEANSELDEVEAIAQIAENLPGMKQKLEKAVKDLYEEMTQDAEEIGRLMSAGAQKKDHSPA